MKFFFLPSLSLPFPTSQLFLFFFFFFAAAAAEASADKGPLLACRCRRNIISVREAVPGIRNVLSNYDSVVVASVVEAAAAAAAAPPRENNSKVTAQRSLHTPKSVVAHRRSSCTSLFRMHIKSGAECCCGIACSS